MSALKQAQAAGSIQVWEGYEVSTANSAPCTSETVQAAQLDGSATPEVALRARASDLMERNGIKGAASNASETAAAEWEKGNDLTGRSICNSDMRTPAAGNAMDAGGLQGPDMRLPAGEGCTERMQKEQLNAQQLQEASESQPTCLLLQLKRCKVQRGRDESAQASEHHNLPAGQDLSALPWGISLQACLHADIPALVRHRSLDASEPFSVSFVSAHSNAQAPCKHRCLVEKPSHSHSTTC